MASTINAFDLLSGAGESVGSAKAKKKKAKAKPQAAVKTDEAPSSTAVGTAAPSDSGETADAANAASLLESSARTYSAGPDRLKLWRDWTKQASSRAAKYRTSNGGMIAFKEMLLRSRALEITVEGCITSPMPADHVSGLQSLLAAFAPRCDAAAASAAVAQLAALLADDTQGFDTAGAAQRGVHALVAALKGDAAGAGAGGAAEQQRSASLTDRLSIIEREASKQRGFLAAVDGLLADSGKAKLPGQGSGVTKAHMDSGRQLVKLFGERFDLLQPEGGAANSSSRKTPATQGAAGAAVRCLEELCGVINTHLKEARDIEGGHTTGPPASKDAQRAAAVAALRREEALLATQASDIAAQIKRLEAQLAQLHSQAADVQDKRTRLHQRQSAALDALGASTGRKMPGLSAQQYSQQLSAATALLSLADPSRVSVSEEERQTAREQHGGSATHDYMTAVRGLLQMCSSSLADVPARAAFCRQRIAQAEKLGSLGPAGADKSAKTREEAERMLADTLRHCEDIMSAAATALDGMRARFPLFSTAAQAELSQAAYEVEDIMTHLRGQHELAMAAVHGQAPVSAPAKYGAGRAAAPAEPPVAAASNGSSKTVAAAPAPAPTVAPVAAAAPQPRPATSAWSTAGKNALLHRKA